MQFALRCYDRLMQFGISCHHESGVFFVQYREAGCDFIFFPFGLWLKRGVNHGFGIDRFAQLDRSVPRTKRVAGITVLELHRGPNFSGTELSNRDTVTPVQIINLADPFEGPARAIEEVAPRLNPTGINPEKPELAELLFVHGLKDLSHRFRIGETNLCLPAVTVDS